MSDDDVVKEKLLIAVRIGRGLLAQGANVGLKNVEIVTALEDSLKDVLRAPRFRLHGRTFFR